MSWRDLVVNSQLGQRSFPLRNLTVTTTFAAWKSTSETMTPGRRIRRLNAVLTRTGSVSSARLASQLRTQKPPVRVTRIPARTRHRTARPARPRNGYVSAAPRPTRKPLSYKEDLAVIPPDHPHSCRKTQNLFPIPQGSGGIDRSQT